MLVRREESQAGTLNVQLVVSVTNEWMASDNPACLEPVPSLEKSNVSTITNIRSVFELSQNIKLSMVFI